MKIYLVGGAVRDEALGLPVTERDWVVVGASVAELTALGFQQVGRDFPVFLHPRTREEYALARTERKSAHGYTGFTCAVSSAITLEEDLARRDLTLNAMAKDEAGQLIDPFHGQRDIAARRLRHVSPAFVDDPVRVLRLARFLARFHAFGFVVAEETRVLLIQMVHAGELNYLVPERVWQEWHVALMTQHPAEFMRCLRACGALKIILPELDALFGVPSQQRQGQYVDTGLQALQALEYAAMQSSDALVRFAVLLLELGKQHTPKQQWPVHADFSAHSVALINALCDRLRIPNNFRQLAVLSATLLLRMQQGVTLGPSGIVQVFESADAFRRPGRFQQLLAVIGAYNYSDELSTPWWPLLQHAKEVSVSALDPVLRGEEIKQACYQQRVARVQQYLTQWEQHEK